MISFERRIMRVISKIGQIVPETMGFIDSRSVHAAIAVLGECLPRTLASLDTGEPEAAATLHPQRL
jgi:hypothetical protein